MTFYLPREYHSEFARVGAVRWHRRIPTDPARPAPTLPDGRATDPHDIDWALLRSLDAPNFIRSLRVKSDADKDNPISGVGMLELGIVARCLAVGPKLLQPSVAVCRALAGIKVRLPVTDYAQPYPSILVRLPQEWVDEVAARHPGSPPLPIILVEHDDVDPRVTLLVSPATGVKGSVLFNIFDRPGITIEDILRGPEMRMAAPRFLAAEVHHRVALNLCLMATYSGVKSAGWLDPKRHAKHEKLARRGDARGRNLLAGDVERIELDQRVELDLGIRFADRPPPQGGTHAAPHPHHRRGHVRWQRVGPGRAGLKLIKIKRTFVRRAAAGAAGVDPRDIGTTYDIE